MASFRKPSSKTKAALEGSTALPPVPADVLNHVGEQAAKLADVGKTGRNKPRKLSSTPAIIGQIPTSQPVDSPSVPGSSPGPWADGMSLDLATLADPIPPVTDSVADTVVELAQDQVNAFGNPAPGADHAAMTDVAHDEQELAPAATHTPTELAGTAIPAIDTTEMQASGEPESPDLLGATEARREEASAPAAPVAQVVVDMHVTLSTFAQAYFADTLDLMTEMTAARSIPDVLTLQWTHMQRRMHLFASQSREWSVLANRLAQRALLPV